ncbi:MAG TPA: redoxin domain-containing protein [Myxococcaceae bacterium]|nr:redoxin domain-containing protein [Myxococcaceae bacterium]
MKKWIAMAVALVVTGTVVAIFATEFGKDPHAVPFKLAGQPAPTFHLVRLDNGETVSLDQFKGRPLVLNFWATWCGPCKMEHPVLSWGAREFNGQVQFLGLLSTDSKENAVQFVRENGSSYPQLLDVDGMVGVDYGIAGVPETYFIDSQGIIREKYAMPIDPQTLVEKVRALLPREARK